MTKRVWMTEAEYKALKKETEQFARAVIDVFGLADQYPNVGGVSYTLWGPSTRGDGRALDFINDVRDASKHAAAKDAVKRLRTAIKVVS